VYIYINKNTHKKKQKKNIGANLLAAQIQYEEKNAQRNPK